MNGAHDLGGKHGFGPIDRSQSENFTHDWEEKVFSLTLACGMLGQWNLDQSRFARERSDPAEYLSSGYYEHWLHGLELLLVEQGVVTDEELSAGVSQKPGGLSSVPPEKLDGILLTGASTLLPDSSEPKFQLNDRVVVSNSNPKSHTRAPTYVKGRSGKIISHHGSHVFADEHSASGIKQPAHLYGVRFEAVELWGADAADKSAVYVDLFEPYLMQFDDYLQQVVGAN